MSAVIMLFILTLILFVQRGGWAVQSHRVDIRVSPTAERLICQQIHGNAVFVALPWWGQTNIVELQRWRFLLTHLHTIPTHRRGWTHTATVTADVYRPWWLNWVQLRCPAVLHVPAANRNDGTYCRGDSDHLVILLQTTQSSACTRCVLLR